MIQDVLDENYKYHYLLRASIFGELTPKSMFLTQGQRKLLKRVMATKERCL